MLRNRKTSSDIPFAVSAHDFERYLPTAPLLSSKEAGWDYLTVRAYREPPQLEETFFPGGPDIYLVYAISGAVQISERKLYGSWRTYEIQQGDWYLTPANGEPYALRWKSVSPLPHQTLQFHLNADLFAQMVQQVIDRDPAQIVLQERTGFQDPLLANLGLSLQQELRDPTHPFLGRMYAETAAQMLSAHLLRHYTTVTTSLREDSRKLSSRQIQRVTAFVLDHLTENLSVDLLAQQVGFSPYHFSRLFRQTTGESPHQFVVHQRLRVAQHLLKETTLPLSQVALEIGIANQSHFAQVFKRYVGISPSLYRQQP